MTTPPETEGTGRARFKYLSDDPSPVSLPGTADATPSVIRPGDVVEVNAETADLLRADEAMWQPTDEAYTVPPNRRQQREAEAKAQADADELKGDKLDRALKTRGLPVTGTADEKRAAVAAYDAAEAAKSADAANQSGGDSA